MAEVSFSRTISAEPEAIWDVLADFGALSTWADGVDHSCVLSTGADADPIGMTRRVQVGRDTLVETITAFAPPRLLAYDISGLPSMLSASNRWNVTPAGNGRTTVTLTSTVWMKPHPLRLVVERVGARLFAKRSKPLLDSLARHLERTR
ncbi:MAG: SRPBCC family protein [Mycobacterium sp.]|nr:SRPBCC family protein [Mycobacterium sp.]